MNKFLLSSIYFLFVANFYSQNTNENIKGFKKEQVTHHNYNDVVQQKNSEQSIEKTKFTVPNSQKIAAVTVNRFTGSMNAFGILYSESKPLQYNSYVNAISFIHRKSSTYTPNLNGNAGSIVGMYSTNSGTSWDSTCIWANALNFANNPQGGIWNPLGNTNILNSWIAGCGPLHDGSGWGGNWYASKQLNTGSNNTPGTDQQALLNISLPGFMKHDFSQYSFTSIEGGFVRSVGNILSDPNGVTNATFGLRGAAMVKGQFNAGAFIWSVDSFVPCVMNRADGSKYLNKKMIQAWSENGATGYVIILGVRCGGAPCFKSYQPIVYKTTNFGSSWVLLPAYDFTTFNQLNDRMYPINTMTNVTVPYFSSNEGIDATVDFNGNLHLVCTAFGAYTLHNDSLDYIRTHGFQKYRYGYASNFDFPIIYDFSTTNAGSWKGMIVDSMGTEGPSGTNGQPGYANNPWSDGAGAKMDLNARIQISRSSDGQKIFYSWTESDSTFVGFKWNAYPDLMMKGYDVTANKLTTRFNISAGILSVDNESYFHYMSPKAISTGTTSFEIPFTISHNLTYNGGAAIDHFYLKGATMAANNFSINPMPTLMWPIFSNCATEVPEEKASINSFNVIPNPTSSIVFASFFTRKTELVRISIYDYLGRVIEDKNIKSDIGQNNISIDLSEYFNGLYFISIVTDSFSETKKIIKE